MLHALRLRPLAVDQARPHNQILGAFFGGELLSPACSNGPLNMLTSARNSPCIVAVNFDYTAPVCSRSRSRSRSLVKHRFGIVFPRRFRFDRLRRGIPRFPRYSATPKSAVVGDIGAQGCRYRHNPPPAGSFSPGNEADSDQTQAASDTARLKQLD